MEEWRRILAESVVSPKDLAAHLGVDPHEIEAVVGDYPMRITPTVLATITSTSIRLSFEERVGGGGASIGTPEAYGNGRIRSSPATVYGLT